MMSEIIVKYIHFICVFLIVGTVFAEHLLLKKELSRKEMRRLSRIDALYGLSALILLIAGLILWFGVGKPASFYSMNWIFHLKLTLFVMIGLLSIYPTLFFIKQRKGQEDEIVEVPIAVIVCIRIELFLLFAIPIFATLMAKGVGYFG